MSSYKEQVKTLVELHKLDVERRAYVAKNFEALREIREALRITQKEVAVIAGVSQGRVSAVENGSTFGISAEALGRLLNVYKELFDAGH